MVTESAKVEVHDFNKQQMIIKFSGGKQLVFIDFESYEVFAKMIYSNYKKMKYVFSKAKKVNGK